MATTLIKNGQVFDGTQNPSRRASVLIQNGKIIQISKENKETEADRIIDASGNGSCLVLLITTRTMMEKYW